MKSPHQFTINFHPLCRVNGYPKYPSRPVKGTVVAQDLEQAQAKAVDLLKRTRPDMLRHVSTVSTSKIEM